MKSFLDFCKTTVHNSTSDSLDGIIKMMEGMGSFQSPGSSDVLKNLIATMQSLKGGRPEPKLANKIMKNLRSSRDRAVIFGKLKALSFRGSIHCELNLACFMMPQSSELPEEYRQIVDELSVSCTIVSTSMTLILSFLYFT